MNPYELKTEDEWSNLLTEIERESGMVAALTDAEGAILQAQGERHRLCAAIRGDPDALSAVCSQVNTVMLAAARKTLAPLVDACDVGLLRMAVPIVRDGQVVGQVTACGLAPADEEVDPFYVAKLLGLREEEAADLVAEAPPGDEAHVEEVATRVFAELNPDAR